MRFAQRTYAILPRQPSQPIFSGLSLLVTRTEGLSTFKSDNRPTTHTFHVELAGVRAMSRSSTPSLVPVNLVCSSGVLALAGRHLVDMLPRHGDSSETEMFVANRYHTIPPSGSTDIEPGDLLGTSFSPLIPIPTSTLQDINTQPLPTDIDALHNNIPVADDVLPRTEAPLHQRYPAPSLGAPDR